MSKKQLKSQKDIFSSTSSEFSSSGGNIHEYSVSELSEAIRDKIEKGFAPVIRVRGELGRISRPSSGHCYFDVKDARSILSCIIWRGSMSLMLSSDESELIEGLEVVLSGRLTTFSGQSRYQMIVSAISKSGKGALMALLEERRKKFELEGIFASEHKKSLPFLPSVIGVITSESGAVIQDILHRLQERMPTRVLLWSVAVQGKNCSSEVKDAIDGFNSAKFATSGIIVPEILIIARGGGSVEDLWGYNDEEVVRSVFASKIPVISAIGHETDWTLLDYVADQRAPTPTAAALMVVPVQSELLLECHELRIRLCRSLLRNNDFLRQKWDAMSQSLYYWSRLFNDYRQTLDNLAPKLSKSFSMLINSSCLKLQKVSNKLSLESLQGMLAYHRLGFSSTTEKLSSLLRIKLNDYRVKLRDSSRFLQSLSYRETLKRGFALVTRSSDNKLIMRASDLEQIDSKVKISFYDKKLNARIDKDK